MGGGKGGGAGGGMGGGMGGGGEAAQSTRGRKFTLAEVKKHNTAADGWVCVEQ